MLGFISFKLFVYNILNNNGVYCHDLFSISIFLWAVYWAEFHYSFLCHCLEESTLFLVGSWVMIPTTPSTLVFMLTWSLWKCLCLNVSTGGTHTASDWQRNLGAWENSLVKVSDNILMCSTFPLVDFHASRSWGAQAVLSWVNSGAAWSTIRFRLWTLDISINWNTKYALDSFSYSITRYWRIYELSAKGEKWCSVCHWECHNKLSCELSVCIPLMLSD